MNLRTEIREFLSSRRSRISPEQAGLSAYGGNRRVKGLRREEVAMPPAVAALQAVLVDEGLLQRVQPSIALHPFDRGDLGAVMHDRQRQARDNTLPVDKDGARTAGSLVAAFLAAGQARTLAQHVQ